MSRQSAFIAFLGNIDYDSRCLNLFNSLSERNYNVTAVGFDWTSPEFSTITSDSKSIYKLDKKKSSVLFYFKFASILKWKLFTVHADVYFAEDIYTLPFVVFFAKIRNAKIVYDARELFGNLAGLVEKQKIQKVLRWIEKFFIKKVDLVLTTGFMDAEFLTKEYQVSNIIVIKNLPDYKKSFEPVNFSREFNLPGNSRYLIYQGVILHGRGLKYIYRALKKLEGYYLIIIGDGEYKNYYEALAADEGIKDKVKFTGRIDQDKLFNYTSGGTIGLSLIENVSLSYYYALPNKMFEYILCGLPVLTSNLPQMMQIIDQYKVGYYVDPENIDEIVEKIKQLEDEEIYNRFKDNCRTASLELNWQKEVQILFERL